MFAFGFKAAALAALFTQATALLDARETDTQYMLENDRLHVAVGKSTGQMVEVVLDGQDLLGPVKGNTGKGPYVDCSCVPRGFWTPGGSNLKRFELYKGVDGTGTPYGGVMMEDRYAETNQTIAQWWFLREGETGLHLFTRVAYYNEARPFLRGLGELRTLFRPNTPLWTHLSGSDGNWAPIPSRGANANAITVQDATTYLGNTTDDAYVQQYSDYFTKYTFTEAWRDHDVHGQYADGSTSSDGNTYGAWLVHNTRETYYGGPLHADLIVDGIVYNYMVSGHYGAPTPNITHGFDRIWGPQYYHFNKGGPNATLAELRADAAQYADPEWNAEFYDSIAEHVPHYAPSSRRTTFRATIELPEGAERPIAVLSENGQDFQLNVFNQDSLQYWADVDPATGAVEIPRVREGTYRLTVYADGIFGWFIQDDVEVSKSEEEARQFRWEPESAGREVWRIGVPDKSAGEFKHGYAPDTSKPLQPEQYRIYWAKWDFPTDFPEGVVFTIGESDEAEDFNYVHWSVFFGYANFLRPEPYYENVNNWTIRFDLGANDLRNASTGTLTVQFAGVKTANGNNKWAELPNEPYSNLPYTVALNGKDVETWVIPKIRSGSCGVRSGVICQNFDHKFEFPAGALKEGTNEFVLSLPFNATNKETALLPGTTYVQYDALSDVPGPLLASVSRLWHVYHFILGDQMVEFVKLHDKHGHFVRIADDEVSVSHPDGGYWYAGVRNPDYRFIAPFTVTDPKAKMELSKMLSSGFTLSNILQSEEAVDRTVEYLLGWLGKYSETQQPIELDLFLRYTVFDLLGEVVFSKPFGFIREGRDIGGAVATATASSFTVVFGYYRRLCTLFLMNPLTTWLQILPTSQLLNTAMETVSERQKNVDAHSDLVAHWLKAMQQYPDRLTLQNIQAQATNFMAAGSETAATALQAFIYFMIRHPKALARVHEEMEVAVRNGLCRTRVVTYADAQKLPYLQACIKEALRFYSPVSMPLPRVAPQGGIVIGDRTFPAGTILSICTWVVHLSKEIWGPDAREFNPDRWFRTGATELEKKYFIPFHQSVQ
ncbi:hypothetical protein DL766_001052 [Monosporascus sp. MC13-8B]|nr:hypothetical protein DL763_002077 [Monosporascus cannonballus]RYP38257.1 hypothetical protein DL766_001052 [Monosporascus sp. MC13-8B]